MKARALIIITATNDCSLSIAVSKIMGPIQQRMGSRCPFTIIGYSTVYEIYAQSVKPGSKSIAAQYLRASNNWSRRNKEIEEVFSIRHTNTYGKQNYEKNLNNQQCDINSVCTHVILFEAIEERKRHRNAANTQREKDNRSRPFMSCILERLVATLPSLAIQAQGYEDLDVLADIVNRKIPLLLLDSRERWPLVDTQGTAKTKISSRKIADPREEGVSSPMDPPEWCKNAYGDTEKATAASSADWAFWARKQLTYYYQKLLIKKKCTDSWTASTLSFLRGVKDFQQSTTRSNIKAIQKTQPLFAAIEYGARGGWSNSDGVVDDDELESLLVALFFKLNEKYKVKSNKDALMQFGKTFKDKRRELKKEKQELKDKRKELEKKQHESKGLGFKTKDQGNMNKDRIQEISIEINFIKDELKNGKDMLQEIEDNYEDKNNVVTMEEWLATYDILTSKTCYAESIFDLEGIALIMGNIAKIDHLPEYHTPEALALLRRSWSDIDAYHAYADNYKMYAKVTYAITLALGLGIATSASYFAQYAVPLVEDSICPACLCDDVSKMEHQALQDSDFDNLRFAQGVTLALSLLSSVVAGISTFTNPGSRWQHLRSSALNLESEIWSFRTRTGKYREGMHSQGRLAETSFHERIKDIGESTLTSGDLRRTNFYGQSQSKFFKHQQFAPPKVTKTCWEKISAKVFGNDSQIQEANLSKNLEMEDLLKRATFEQLMSEAKKLDLSVLVDREQRELAKVQRKKQKVKKKRKEEEEEEDTESDIESETEEEEEGNNSTNNSATPNLAKEDKESMSTEVVTTNSSESNAKRTQCSGGHNMTKLRQKSGYGCDGCGCDLGGNICFGCRGCDEDYCTTCFDEESATVEPWNGEYVAGGDNAGDDAARAVQERDDKELYVKKLSFAQDTVFHSKDFNTSMDQYSDKNPYGSLSDGIKKPNGILTEINFAGTHFSDSSCISLSFVFQMMNNQITHLSFAGCSGLYLLASKSTRNYDQVKQYIANAKPFFKVTHLNLRDMEGRFIDESLATLENSQTVWTTALTSEYCKITHLDLSKNPLLCELNKKDFSVLKSVTAALKHR